MRLYNIYYLCKTSIDEIRDIHLEKIQIGETREYDYNVKNWNNLFMCCEVLVQIDFLKEDIEKLLTYMDEASDNKLSNYLRMTPMIAKSFEEYRKKIISKMELVIELYQSLGIEDSEIGIDIKIPKCYSLREYMQFVKDIDFVFSQCPLISQCNETINFNTVDIGSMWLSFVIKSVVGSSIILNVIAKMVDIALKIRTRSIINKQQEEVLEALRQKNEVGAEVIEAFEKLKKAMLDESVKELEKECNTEIKDPEDRDRAGRTLEILSIIIDKGVEIYSAIGVSKEIQAQFPFKEDSPIITEEFQKLIEDKEKNKEG